MNKTDKRIEFLKEHLEWSEKAQAYVNHNFYVPMIDIITLSDEDFNKLMIKIQDQYDRNES